MDYNHFFNKSLISSVKQNTVIWDRNASRGPAAKIKFELAWIKISKSLGLRVEVCKKKWKALRDRFVKESKKPTSNWVLMKDLIFLKDVIYHRNKKQSINSLEIDNELRDNMETVDSFDHSTVKMEYLISNQCVENKKIDEIDKLPDEFGIKYGEITLFQNTFFYQCIFCTEKFTSGTDFEHHAFIVHLKSERSYQVKEEIANDINVEDEDIFIDTSDINKSIDNSKNETHQIMIGNCNNQTEVNISDIHDLRYSTSNEFSNLPNHFKSITLPHKMNKIGNLTKANPNKNYQMNKTIKIKKKSSKDEHNQINVSNNSNDLAKSSPIILPCFSKSTPGKQNNLAIHFYKCARCSQICRSYASLIKHCETHKSIEKNEILHKNLKVNANIKKTTNSSTEN